MFCDKKADVSNRFDAILGSGLLGACASPDAKAPLEIKSAETTFFTGDEVIDLTLVNASDASVYYGEAFALDRGSVGDDGGMIWTDIYFEAEGDYLLDPLWQRLEPEETTVYSVSLAAIGREHHFEPGRYRLCIPYYVNEDIKTRRLVAFVFEFKK
jgi:hypothetical protein